jgi:tetratricopeptide (TPR) repeat protein
LEAISSTEKGDFETSLKIFNHVLEEAEDRGSRKHMIQAYLNFGGLYWRFGENETALNYYFKALDLAKEYDHTDLLNAVYNNIGIIYSTNNESNKALENFKEALKISKELGYEEKVVINLINISNVYLHKEDYVSAENYLYEAKEIVERLKDSLYLSNIFNTLGDINMEQEKYQGALMNYKNALEHADSTDIFYYSYYNLNLGKAYNAFHEYDSAIFYTNKSLKFSLELNHKENIINAYSLLAEIYQEYGYLNKALMNYNKSLAWKDSLLNEKSQKWVSEMQMKYEFGKKEKEVEFLERKNKLNIFIWIISVSVLFIVGFLSIYSLRSRNIKVKQRNELLRKEKELAKLEKEKAEAENIYLHEEMTAAEELNRIKEEKLKQEIEHKNRELSSQALHAVNKNEILKEINEKIAAIDPTDTADTNLKISKIKNLIRNFVSLEGDWDDFKLHFEKVHTDFFYRLERDFPDLSQGDMRFCAYSILNLSNKEIAQIFNISPDSVRKRKQRLREKMDLPKDLDLHEFLIKYS